MRRKDGRRAVGVDRAGRTGPRIVHADRRGSAASREGRLFGHGREVGMVAGRDPAADSWRGWDREARGKETE